MVTRIKRIGSASDLKVGFTAKFHGICIRCGKAINPGDAITKDGRGRPQQSGFYGKKYFHIVCNSRPLTQNETNVVPEIVIRPEPAKIEAPVFDVTRWVEVVQRTRKLAAENRAQFVISPRASIKGAQLLRAGVSAKATVEAVFGRYRGVDKWAVVGEHAESFARTFVVPMSENAQRWQKIALRAGTQHEAFKILVMLADALGNDDRNIWLAGPAGSGKTTAARKLAECLDMSDRFEFNGAIDTEYKLSGFVDAKGRVVSTAFRRIWENGGVYLFDECDASMPGALLAFNAALANGYAAFPDGTIQRHKDTVIIAAANTWGFGGDANYIGRAKLDAAFLDRFVTLTWNYDEALEMKLALSAN